MILIVLVIVIIVLLVWIYKLRNRKCEVDLSMEMDIYPSDDEGFLKHMIHHHQVAVDMSEHLLKYTRDPRMISFCRDIIWLQKYEILQMHNLLESKPYVAPLLIPRDKVHVGGTPSLQKYYPKQSSYQKKHKKHHQMQETDEAREHKMHHILNEPHVHIPNPPEHHHHQSSPKSGFITNKVVDRSGFFPEGDNPLEQIEELVNEGYYPNNPPLDNPDRNANVQLRSEAPNVNKYPSPWNQTTISADIDRRPFEFESKNN